MSQHMSKKKKKIINTPLLITLIGLLCILLAVVGFYKVQSNKKQIEYEKRVEFETKALATAKANRLERERIAEEKRIAAEKKAEEERIAAEKKAEEERIATEKKAEQERIAAERRKKAEEERIRIKKAKAEALRKERERSKAEKARLDAEKRELARLRSVMKAQKENLLYEQSLYNEAMPTPIVDLPVSLIWQNPELPNGCEITAGAIVLNYLGYSYDKCTLADVYLPQVEFYDENKQRMGGDPNQVYCGNPRYARGGYYCFAKPLVDACNKALTDYSSSMTARDVTGSSEQQLLSYLDQGSPVIAFTTLSMGEAVKFEPSKWKIINTNQYHIPFINLHCVVLYGYDDEYIYICDPLEGRIQCKRSSFMKAYQSIGSRAVIITE